MRTTNDNDSIRSRSPSVEMEDRERVFQALGSAVRLSILVHLAGGSLTAGQIAQRFTMTKSSLSRHLSVLEGAGLILGCRKGQFIHYSAVDGRAAGVFAGTLDTLDKMPARKREARQDRDNNAHLPPVVVWLQNSGN